MHTVFNPVAPYRYLLPNMYLSVVDISNPELCAYFNFSGFVKLITYHIN